MTLVDSEIARASQYLARQGKSPEDFVFSVNHLPPDPEAGAMFTERYVVTVTQTGSGKAEEFLGGIGLDWLSSLEEALAEGAFD